MQPFMKNVAVEYAAKALPDGELAKEIKDLKDIPVLTEDNALEIFEKKPKTINYDGIIYNLQDISDSEQLYYSSIYEDYTLSTVIDIDGTIHTNEFPLAKTTDLGTRLYLHKLNGLSIYQGCTIYIMSTVSAPITDRTSLENTIARSTGFYLLGGGVSVPTRVCPLSGIFANPAGSGVSIVWDYATQVDTTLVLTRAVATGTFTDDEVTLMR